MENQLKPRFGKQAAKQERRIADSGTPIRDKESKIIGIVLVFRNITEELRTEQELIKVKRLESIGVLRGNTVACRYFFPDNLWLVDIDKGQISQVVQNLIWLS